MKKATDTKFFMEVKSLKPLRVEAEFCKEKEARVTLHQCILEALYDCPEPRKLELADRIINHLEAKACDEIAVGIRRYFSTVMYEKQMRNVVEVAGESVLRLAAKLEESILSIDRILGKKKRKGGKR